MKMFNCKNHESERGQALIATVIFMLFISAAGAAALSSTALSEMNIAQRILSSENALYAAEAGIEDVVYRIKEGKQYGSLETLGTGNGTTTISVVTNGTAREVTSEGSASSGIRKVAATLQVGAGISFVYGAQVGRGGILMENSSRIEGSVYSNGDILGESIVPIITGDAYAATTKKIKWMVIQGSAQANLIEEVIIGKNASSTTDISEAIIGQSGQANRILSSVVGKNAYYQTSISGTTVLGATYPGTPPPSTLPEIPMPIPDTTLDAWETEALAGGTISSPCPYDPGNGASIGPKKINCDVEINNSDIVTLTGSLWISGNLTIKNSAQLKLSSSYGSNSGVVIVDNPANRTTSSKIFVENSSEILGSGTAGSYIMLASRNNSAENGGAEDAISVKNSSSAAIYYAPHGSVYIQNSATLKEVTAYMLKIKNSATVVYESGLATIKFSTGPAGGYTIDAWKETE